MDGNSLQNSLLNQERKWISIRKGEISVEREIIWTHKIIEYKIELSNNVKLISQIYKIFITILIF